MFSLASVATMSACIFLFGIFFCVVENFQSMVKEAESGVSVTVFFDEDIAQDQAAIDAIGEKIKVRDEVSELRFISAEEAWEEYKDIYFAEAPQLAEGFAEDNPLANQAHYEIFLKDVKLQDSLVEYLGSVEGIRRINASAEVADILSNFNLLIGYVSIAIIILLLCVSVFLISNTVTIGIAVRKEEIAIMKLIGASIPLGLLYWLYTRLIAYVAGEFNILTGFLQFLPVEEVFRTLLPVGLILGVGIGFFGSFFTIRKHLKV